MRLVRLCGWHTQPRRPRPRRDVRRMSSRASGESTSQATHPSTSTSPRSRRHRRRPPPHRRPRHRHGKPARVSSPRPSSSATACFTAPAIQAPPRLGFLTRWLINRRNCVKGQRSSTVVSRLRATGDTLRSTPRLRALDLAAEDRGSGAPAGAQNWTVNSNGTITINGGCLDITGTTPPTALSSIE
jgi:hypothetical protein